MKGTSMQLAFQPAHLWQRLQHLAERLTGWLPETRFGRKDWLLMAAFFVVTTVVSYTLAFELWPAPVMAFLKLLREATNGLITSSNLSLIAFAGLLFACLAFTPLALRDIGLNRRNLLRAPLLLVVFWLSIQLVAVLFALVQAGDIRLHERWLAGQLTVIAGGFLGQLFGNALYEEVLFRGVILTQLIVLLRARLSPLVSLLLALLLANAFFALVHVDNWLFVRTYLIDQFGGLTVLLWRVFESGLFWSLVFLATRNILVPVVLHTLINTPLLLVDPQWPEQTIVQLGVYLVLLVWLGWWFWQRRRTADRKVSLRV